MPDLDRRSARASDIFDDALLGEALIEHHPLRCQVLRTVQRRLGIIEAHVIERTGLTRGAARHHLNVLVDAGVLERFPLRGQTHYFPAGMAPELQTRLAVATHSRSTELLRLVLEQPGVAQNAVTGHLRMTRKILRHHVDLLTQNDLLVEKRVGRLQRYWPGPAMDEVIHERILYGIVPCHILERACDWRGGPVGPAARAVTPPGDR